MSDKTRISFIGGGVMANAFVESLLGKGIASESDVMVSSRSWATLEVMRERHHVHTTLSNHEAAQFGDVVLLAVKPQNLDRVFSDIKGAMRPEQILLSIVAGAGIQGLREGTGHDRIVRCMPNTPAQIGAGVSVWMASPEVAQEDRTLVRSVLGAVGVEIEVDEERYVDMATAVTSPGGTTAEALYELEKGGFRTAISKAVWAAYQRTLTLKG